ncbi:hypothetical protein BKA93DRAFT_746787 [Sparassis latifolia]
MMGLPSTGRDLDLLTLQVEGPRIQKIDQKLDSKMRNDNISDSDAVRRGADVSSHSDPYLVKREFVFHTPVVATSQDVKKTDMQLSTELHAIQRTCMQRMASSSVNAAHTTKTDQGPDCPQNPVQSSMIDQSPWTIIQLDYVCQGMRHNFNVPELLTFELRLHARTGDRLTLWKEQASPKNADRALVALSSL